MWKFEKRDLVELLELLGVDTVSSWSCEKLEKKLNTKHGIDAFFVPGRIVVGSPAWTTYHRAVLASKIHVVQTDPEGDDRMAATKKKQKRVTVAAGEATSGYPKGWADWPESKKVDYWRKNPRQVPTKGVAAVAIRELRRVGKMADPKGLTKMHLLALLQRAFPDRDVVAMQTNLNNLVPSRLRDIYGLRVEWVKAADGHRAYYIPPDEPKDGQ